MNRERLEGNWKQFGGRIQERDGTSKEEAAHQLKYFLNRYRSCDL